MWELLGPRRDKPRMLDTLALAPASDLQKPSLGHQLWGPQKVGMEGGPREGNCPTRYGLRAFLRPFLSGNHHPVTQGNSP